MNRLTERLPNGVVRAPVTDENRGDSCMMRLAAYEDTGLTPEEVAHAKDLLAAEKGGRLVTLPCKVGDTVYYPYVGRVIPKRITQYREILRKSEAIDRWYCLEFSNDETFDAEDIGKTVFLTRAEAEKALGKEAQS